jgi:hypothetical protein
LGGHLDRFAVPLGPVENYDELSDQQKTLAVVPLLLFDEVAVQNGFHNKFN